MRGIAVSGAYQACTIWSRKTYIVGPSMSNSNNSKMNDDGAILMDSLFPSPAAIIVEPADGWSGNDTRIACRDNIAFLSAYHTGSLNLCVSSPPYGIGKQYETKKTIEQYTASQVPIVQELARVIAVDGWVCWQVGNWVGKREVLPLDYIAIPLFAQFGFTLRRRFIWQFGSGLHCKHRFSGRHETILCFSKSKRSRERLIPEAEPAIWDIPNVKNNHLEKTIHPCSFPVELAERLVLSYSNPGDTVLDPFMGVGSTLIAAARHGRIPLGCDLDQRYVEITLNRLDHLAKGTLKTRPMGKPVHIPRPSKNHYQTKASTAG
jgi:adenine-specific DNA-methyltransferase